MSSTPTGTTPADDTTLEIYKSEYELTAARYENIFKAIWQNFSYMTAVSGAVLAFGSDRLQPHFLWFIVCLPLVFWFLATYLPLDRYGDMAGVRLRVIEGILNNLYNTHMGHFDEFEARKSAGGLRSLLRVRYMVRVFFVPLCFIFAYHACFTARALCEGNPLTREQKFEVKIVTVSPDELEKLLAEKGMKPSVEAPIPATATPKGKD